MKQFSLFSSAILVFALVPACTVKATGADEQAGSAEEQLVADNSEVEDTEENTEVGIEEPLSGADVADSSMGADPSAAEAEHMERVRTNPGKFFKPAGCITTTVDPATRVANHVFKDCTGPAGLRTFNGTVQSTWNFSPGQLVVQHNTSGFKVNGATITRNVTITYKREGTVFTRIRKVEMSGQTAKGKEFRRDANWTVAYDAAAKCIKREGSSSSVIGLREFSSSIENYKRCGIGQLGCPESGRITLSRKKGQGEAAQDMSLMVEFLGGKQMRIILPSGRIVSRGLICREVQ